MATNWDEYQEEAAEFFRSLGLEATTNVSVPGARTTHDVDVLVKSKHAGFEVTWIVECKHWNSRVSKLHVLALREIVSDIGADRGILLAENGFQSGTVEAAALTNVQLTSLFDARQAASGKIFRMRLAEIHDRLENSRERYWKIPKSVRIEYGLRIFEEGFSGASVIDFSEEILRKAFRGIYPFEVEIAYLHAFPVFPKTIDSAETLILHLEPHIKELERRLDHCMENWPDKKTTSR